MSAQVLLACKLFDFHYLPIAFYPSYIYRFTTRRALLEFHYFNSVAYALSRQNYDPPTLDSTIILNDAYFDRDDSITSIDDALLGCDVNN